MEKFVQAGETQEPVKPSTRFEVGVMLAQSRICKEWHWFGYHFRTVNLPEWEHPLARSIIDALVICNRAMPGYASSFISRLAAICGREKYKPHYEQLLQNLAELHVVLQVVSFEWPGGAQFALEPTAEGSKKNPEITVLHGGILYGIEVKAPALLAHVESRNKNGLQLPARVFTQEMIHFLKNGEEEATLPRDNPVKDFLLSADAKFAAFREAADKFIGILVIVWDDHVYEPISSLLHESSGLLTPRSFHVDSTGTPIPFLNVDGVFLIRHLHQLARAAGDQPLLDGCTHALDYGTDGDFPFKVFVQNPNGKEVPGIIQRCLQGIAPRAEMGAEYTPKDLIRWTNIEPEA